MTYRFILLSMLLALASGCGSPRIDASSGENLKVSIQTAKKSLSAEDQKEFAEAIKALTFEGVDNIFELAANPGGLERRFKEKLDGRSAKDIIAAGKRVIAERREKQRTEIVGEIKQLDKKQAKSFNAAEALAAFKVERSRVYYREDRFSRL